MFWKDKSIKVLQAQEKLSSIMQAINRETLVYEEKKEQVASIEVDILEQKKEQDKIASEFEAYKSTIESIKRKDNEEIDVLSSNIQSLRSEKDQIESKNNHIIHAKQEKIDGLDNTITTKIIHISKLEKDISTMEDEVLKIWTIINDGNLLIQEKNAIIKELDNKCDIKNDHIQLLDTNISSKIWELDKYNADIAIANQVISWFNTQREVLSDEIEKNTVLLKDIKTQIQQSWAELEILEQEKSLINTAKFALHQREEANDRREAIIKQRFEEAGVPYS